MKYQLGFFPGVRRSTRVCVPTERGLDFQLTLKRKNYNQCKKKIEDKLNTLDMNLSDPEALRSGFICNALGLAECQQQKSGSVLIVKIENLQEPIQQFVVRSVICTKIEQYSVHR